MTSSKSAKNNKTYFYTSPISGMIDKKCPKALPVIRLKDDFDAVFSWYYESTDKDVEVFRNAYGNRNRPVSDTGVSSRVLSHWADEKIIPEGLAENNKWKTFTLTEIVWLRAVTKMRAFGLSLRKIQHVRNWTMQWDEKHQNYPWFEFYVFWAQVSNEDPYIVILHDGTAELATSSDIERIKSINENISKHILLISLKAILTELKLAVKEIDILSRTSLHDEEFDLIEEIRSKASGEIGIHVRNGNINEMTTSKVYPSQVNIGDIKKEIKETDAFSEITTRYVRGVQQTTEVKIRKRFKKV